MTTVMPRPARPDGQAEVVVGVGEQTAAAALSCRLHGLIAGVGEEPLTVVVEAGDRADDPDLARVLVCARERAASRGLGFVVRSGRGDRRDR